MTRNLAYLMGYRSLDVSLREQVLINTYARPRGLDIQYQSLPAGEQTELVQREIHNAMTDVFELGTTFVQDFIAMNAMRPFRPADVRQMGGADAFVAPAWRAGVSQDAVWAIPLYTDVRLVFYRRDLLEKAGIEEQSAFQTPENFTNTLRRLRESGVSVPWSTPTHSRSVIINQIFASWVWYHGGDFLDETNHKVLIDQPEVIAAAKEYFGLYSFMRAEGEPSAQQDSATQFKDGQAAVSIGGPWTIPYYAQDAELRDKVGVAIPLKQAFVGGSCVGIWKHTAQEADAIELIQILTGLDFQSRAYHLLGQLPARREAFNYVEFPNDNIREMILHALQTGRGFPGFKLWGLVENRLVAIFARLWGEILAQPEPDVSQVVERQLLRGARQLNLFLSQL